jgi:hypothetical protein
MTLQHSDFEDNDRQLYNTQHNSCQHDANLQTNTQHKKPASLVTIVTLKIMTFMIMTIDRTPFNQMQFVETLFEQIPFEQVPFAQIAFAMEIFLLLIYVLNKRCYISVDLLVLTS